MMLGHIDPVQMLFYWAAQICGCAIGALWIAWLVPSLYVRSSIDRSSPRYDGCFVPDPNLTAVQVFGWEAAGTFCFIVPILAMLHFTVTKTGYGNTGPFLVGISLMAVAMAVAPFTSASLNPARTLGSPIVFNCPDNDKIVWYILGELAGAAAVPIVVAPYYGISATSWYLPWIAKMFTIDGGGAAQYEMEPTPLAHLDTLGEASPTSPAGDASQRTTGGRGTPRLERRGTLALTLVAATPGAASTAEAGVREVRYVCLVPGVAGGGGAARRAAARSTIDVTLSPHSQSPQSPSPLNPNAAHRGSLGGGGAAAV